MIWLNVDSKSSMGIALHSVFTPGCWFLIFFFIAGVCKMSCSSPQKSSCISELVCKSKFRTYLPICKMYKFCRVYMMFNNDLRHELCYQWFPLVQVTITSGSDQPSVGWKTSLYSYQSRCERPNCLGTIGLWGMKARLLSFPSSFQVLEHYVQFRGELPTWLYRTLSAIKSQQFEWISIQISRLQNLLVNYRKYVSSAKWQYFYENSDVLQKAKVHVRVWASSPK